MASSSGSAFDALFAAIEQTDSTSDPETTDDIATPSANATAAGVPNTGKEAEGEGKGEEKSEGNVHIIESFHLLTPSVL